MVLALSLAACGGNAEEEPAADTTPAPTEPTEVQESAESEEGSASATITIKDFAFESPETLAPGTEVTVTNEDSVGHTVTSDDEGVFDTPVGPGETVTFTVPDEVGEYAFYCIPHPYMTSTLIVG